MKIPEGIDPNDFYHDISQSEREAINKMQAEMMTRALGKVENVAGEIDWIERYSDTFRKVINANYEIVREFQVDKEKALGKAESLLYRKE